jgi:hypothetical protein
MKLDHDYETKAVTKYLEKAVKCPVYLDPCMFICQCSGEEHHTATFKDLADITGTHEVPKFEPKPFKTVGENMGTFTLEQFEIIYKGLQNTPIKYMKKKYLNLYSLIPQLNFFIHNEITSEDVREALAWLEEWGELSGTATRYLNREFSQLCEKVAENPKGIYHYIKTDNNDYWFNTVKPILPKDEKIDYDASDLIAPEVTARIGAVTSGSIKSEAS